MLYILCYVKVMLGAVFLEIITLQRYFKFSLMCLPFPFVVVTLLKLLLGLLNQHSNHNPTCILFSSYEFVNSLSFLLTCLK